MEAHAAPSHGLFASGNVRWIQLNTLCIDFKDRQGVLWHTVLVIHLTMVHGYLRGWDFPIRIAGMGGVALSKPTKKIFYKILQQITASTVLANGEGMAPKRSNANDEKV